MPTGRHITGREKEQIYFNFFCQGRTVADVYLSVFGGNRQLLSYRRLSELCNSLRHASDDEIDLFLNGVDKRKLFAGRKRKLSGHETLSMLDIIAVNRNQTLKQVRDQYMELWFDDIEANMISETLVYRTFVRERLSHRILETRNMLQDPQQQMDFLDTIRHVDPSRIIDIDGMSQCRKDFLAKYGWGPMDEECVRMQITIHDRSFAVHAAYSQYGFVTWEIFEGTVTQREVTHFIEHHLSPYLAGDAFCIIDNAKNQRTEMVRACLNLYFRGLYLYSPVYSPEFKPIERGFSLIKGYIRKNDCPAFAADPVELIQRAFQNYSVTGESGMSGMKTIVVRFVFLEFLNFRL